MFIISRADMLTGLLYYNKNEQNKDTYNSTNEIFHRIPIFVRFKNRQKFMGWILR